MVAGVVGAHRGMVATFDESHRVLCLHVGERGKTTLSSSSELVGSKSVGSSLSLASYVGIFLPCGGLIVVRLSRFDDSCTRSREL